VVVDLKEGDLVFTETSLQCIYLTTGQVGDTLLCISGSREGGERVVMH